jgi:DNA modification methylase
MISGNTKILQGDALTKLRELESESVDCCITSPPYYKLRDYKADGQLGLERTYQEYLERLIAIFDEVKRVLVPAGSAYVVIGDSYGPDKSLLKIPQRFCIRMIDHGWINRNDLIWYKRNCMPSSIKDRYTVDYELIYFFTKSQKYHFETQYEPLECGLVENALGRIKRCVMDMPTVQYPEAHFAVYPPSLIEPLIKASCPQYVCLKCRTPRKMIYHEERINTRPGLDVGNGKSGKADDPNAGLHNADLSKYRQRIVRYPLIGGKKHAAETGKHNRTYSGNEWQPVISREEAELTDCNCNAGFRPGVCLDPFMGSGTTGEVALSLARNFIGIELNAEYIEKQVMKRLDKYIHQQRLL